MPREMSQSHSVDPDEQIAIAVLTSGGSFADAMSTARLSYEQVLKLWDRWTKSHPPSPGPIIPSH